MSNNIVEKVSERLKLSENMRRKLRTTAQIAGAATDEEVEAVLAGIKDREPDTARANMLLTRPVEYPQRVDECPICYSHMQPVTLASSREAYFCPIHNVCMPSQ